MPGPSTKPERASRAPAYVPHPDDEADVRAAFEAVDRGDVLSAEESAAYLRSLLGEDEPSGK